MPNPRFPKLETPSMIFVGVTTGHSFINKLFPVWAEILELGDVRLVGLDLTPNDTPQAYRKTVAFLKNDPLARGALVTTHKMNLYQHARDLFERFDPYADLLGEVSSISKQGADLVGHAKDPITSGLAFENVAGNASWREHPQAEALLLGSGGSALAFATYLLERPAENQPAKVTITGRTPSKLDHLASRLRPLDKGEIVECRHVSSPEEHDRLVAALPEFSLVANATGMGKDRPGSPVTDAAAFPARGIVWEFNYRGELQFLHQAEAQAASRNLRVADGWCYFLHGWSEVIAEVFHFSVTKILFDELRAAADKLRQAV